MRKPFPSFLKAIRRRQHVALNALVDRYQGLARNTVRRHLGRRLRDRVESEDLLNDFWVSIFRRVDRLPELEDSFALRAYLRRVAFRQVTKQQRRHLNAECRSLNREASVPRLDQIHDPSPPDPAGLDEAHDDILEHLHEHATAREWQILQLKLHGHSNREIGRRLSIDEGSVRRCLRRMGRLAAQAGITSP